MHYSYDTGKDLICKGYYINSNNDRSVIKDDNCYIKNSVLLMSEDTSKPTIMIHTPLSPHYHHLR